MCATSSNMNCNISKPLLLQIDFPLGNNSFSFFFLHYVGSRISSSQFVLVVLGVNVANVIWMGGVNRKKMSSHRPDESQHEMEQTIIGYSNIFSPTTDSGSPLYVIKTVIRQQSFDIVAILQGMARYNVWVVIISRVNNIIHSLQVLIGTLMIAVMLSVVQIVTV